MSSEQPKQTVADYVTIALSPALIMGLVGSLVFFLLEVFYKVDGEYKLRMQWILFFFVFGAVLVSRISMTSDIAGRASLYGGVLAFATWLGLGQFVEYPEKSGLRELSWGINLFLILVVWWCAHQLTRDCTEIDEETDVTDQGLLQAAGLDGQPGPTEPAEKPAEEAVEDEEELEEEDRPKRRKPPAVVAWAERFRKFREERKKKRTLGVWVVYFSLAALPLFGLGQALIPVTSVERRWFAFQLMMIYVGCGLGLLLTTCFLGLRRYLRQRRLQMPAAMTGTWLAMGGGLIVVLLLVGALIPRPHAEYSLTDVLDRVGATKRKASRVAFKGDGTGEGKGQAGKAGPDGEQTGNQVKDGKGNGPGKEGSGGTGEKKNGESGSDSGEKNGNNGEKGGEKSGEKGKPGERSDGPRGEKGAEKPGEGKEAGKAMKGMNEKEGESQRNASSANRTQQALSRVTSVLQSIAPVLKWIVFGVVAVVVVLYALRAGLGFLAGFTDWAKRLLDAWNRFWEGLFAQRKPAGGEGEEESSGEPEERHQPFSDFANPFETGAADDWSVEELVSYTFTAMQAWARERDLARRPGETPLEFSERVGNELPALEQELKRLTALYVRAMYARGGMPGNTREVVRQFWAKLERVTVAPLSA
jgi:hypothetical protein